MKRKKRVRAIKRKMSIKRKKNNHDSAIKPSTIKKKALYEISPFQVQSSITFSEFASSVKKGKNKVNNIPLYEEVMIQEEEKEISISQELNNISDGDISSIKSKDIELSQSIQKSLKSESVHISDISQAMDDVEAQPIEIKVQEIEVEEAEQANEAHEKERIAEDINDLDLKDIFTEDDGSSNNFGSSIFSENELVNNQNQPKDRPDSEIDFDDITLSHNDSPEITSELFRSDEFFSG